MAVCPEESEELRDSAHDALRKMVGHDGGGPALCGDYLLLWEEDEGLINLINFLNITSISCMHGCLARL